MPGTRTAAPIRGRGGLHHHYHPEATVTNTAMSHREHGTRVKYVIDRCRCQPCKAANRTAENHRYRQQAYGRWQPYVDAAPARAHVRQLMDSGLGWQRIAAMAGVGNSVVEKLLYGAAYRGMGPSKRIRPETADKLLAVQPSADALGGAASVDGTGTRRRLRALVASGWPQARLADRLGVHRSNFGKIIHGPGPVLASTERAARHVYDELWNVDPREHGVDNQAYSRARNLAHRQGWAPVGAWDDDTIDDPAAFPDWTGRCGSPAGYQTHKRLNIPMCEPCRVARSDARRAGRTAPDLEAAA